MADGLLLDLPYINTILYWYWKEKHGKSMLLAISIFLLVYIAQHTQHHHQVVHPGCVCVFVTPSPSKGVVISTINPRGIRYCIKLIYDCPLV